jgi:hypothetical protein
VQKSKFSIYPNPAISEINITTADEGMKSFVVYNNMGVQVLTGSFDQSSLTMDISELSNGFYFVELSSVSAGKSTSKFVINR